jgi:hypothetical protein
VEAAHGMELLAAARKILSGLGSVAVE